MNLLIKTCDSSGILQTFFILKIIMIIIFIVVPSLFIIKSFIKFIFNYHRYASEQMTLSAIKLLGCLLLIMFPIFVNSIFSIVDNNYLTCYYNANLKQIKYYKLLENKENEIVNIDEGQEIVYVDKEESELSRKKLFIGDSRTVGMFSALYGGNASYVKEIRDNELWFAKVSMGYNWFVNEALTVINDSLIENDYDVIVLLGVNDAGSLKISEKYTELLNELALQYPDSNFIMVSVNPVNDEQAEYKGYYIRNNLVTGFNQTLQSNINRFGQDNLSYCDTYSNIVDNYYSSDGLHYNAKTSIMIYNLISKCL